MSFVNFVVFVTSVRNASRGDVRVHRRVEPAEREGHDGAAGRAGRVCLRAPRASVRCRSSRGCLEFCRVAATLTPSSDSDIKIEVWLPASGWNGKFQAVGNGGWNGNVPYAALANAVIAGYATAGTDTGHVGNTAAFALGHPEKLIDFGYRAVHEMTVKAKSIIDAFYGRCADALDLQRMLAGRAAGDHRRRSGIQPTSTASSSAHRP